MESTLGVEYDLMLALRSQICEYLSETFYRHALEYLQSARSKKKKENIFTYGNAWLLLTFLRICGRWEHVFATSASPSTWQKKLAMSPSSVVHAVSTILNMWHSSSYGMRHSWRSQFGRISMDQLVCMEPIKWDIRHLRETTINNWYSD